MRSMSLERVAGQSNSACPQGNERLKMKTDLAVHCKGEFPSRRDILEIDSFQGGKNTFFYNEYQSCTNPKELGSSLRYRYSHTIGHTSTWFFETAGAALRSMLEKEEKKNYDAADVERAYDSAYRSLCEEIEKRHESGGEQWFDLDGSILTKEREMECLNEAYEAAAAFRASSAVVMSGLRQFYRPGASDRQTAGDR